MIVTPSQEAIDQALRAFLILALPAGIEVVRGQENRVPEPIGDDFVVFWTIRRARLETNIDAAQDTLLTAAIAGTILTVSEVAYGEIQIGDVLFGSGLVSGTTVTALGTGTGGVGTYGVTPGQTVSERGMASGAVTVTQPQQITYQVDVHGSNSADNAVRIATLFRDDFAVQSFLASAIDAAPLYAEDPRQMPFQNAEQQYEERWVVELQVQANQSMRAPQQFAGILAVTLINVDETFPPS